MSDQAEQSIKAIVFQLNEEEYAISIKQVGSIERMQHITRVPKTSDFVRGVINLRGVVTPVIDLRKRFNLGEANFTDSTRMIIVTVSEMEVGLIVDAAHDVINIPLSSIEPAPEVVDTVDADYIEGVAKLGSRLLILLSMEKVLSQEDINTLKVAEETK